MKINKKAKMISKILRFLRISTYKSAKPRIQLSEMVDVLTRIHTKKHAALMIDVNDGLVPIEEAVWDKELMLLSGAINILINQPMNPLNLQPIQTNPWYTEGQWAGQQMLKDIEQTMYGTIPEAIRVKEELIVQFEKEFGYCRTGTYDRNYAFNLGILDVLRTSLSES